MKSGYFMTMYKAGDHGSSMYLPNLFATSRMWYKVKIFFFPEAV